MRFGHDIRRSRKRFERAFDGVKAEIEADHLERALTQLKKMEQKELLDKLSQAIKTEIESLPDYQSMTVEMVGLDQDSYQYKVKLQGETEDLWVEVYSTELGYHEKLEDKEYGVGISQYRRHAS